MVKFLRIYDQKIFTFVIIDLSVISSTRRIKST